MNLMMEFFLLICKGLKKSDGKEASHFSALGRLLRRRPNAIGLAKAPRPRGCRRFYRHQEPRREVAGGYRSLTSPRLSRRHYMGVGSGLRGTKEPAGAGMILSHPIFFFFNMREINISRDQNEVFYNLKFASNECSMAVFSDTGRDWWRRIVIGSNGGQTVHEAHFRLS